jgi:beta-glucosidase
VQRSLEHRGHGLPPAVSGTNLIRLDSSLGCPFLPALAPAIELPAAAGYRPVLLDCRSPSAWTNEPEAPLALDRLDPGPVLLQLFVRGNPFRGSADGLEAWPSLIRQLLAADRLAGLTVLGSPYLWQALRPLLPPDLPAAYSPGQMPLAQQEVLRALGLGGTARAGDFTD